MAKQNYYERVVKRHKMMKRDLSLKAWAKKEWLTDKQLDRAIHALIHGKSFFD